MNEKEILKEALEWWYNDIQYMTSDDGENLFKEDPDWVIMAKKLIEHKKCELCQSTGPAFETVCLPGKQGADYHLLCSDCVKKVIGDMP